MQSKCPTELQYLTRYGKRITVPEGYISDGATGAIDIYSNAWWFHDKLCDTGTFDDGTKCTNWQASTVLHDVLKAEGRNIRCVYWRIFTFLFGCSKCRDNGMIKLKSDNN